MADDNLPKLERIDGATLARAFMRMPRGQELLPAEIAERMPKLYATEHQGEEEKVAQVRYFSPVSKLEWYGIEYDPEERLFFAYTVGDFAEYGYLSLDELESLGAAVERDEYFSPQTMAAVKQELRQRSHAHGLDF